MADAPKKTDAKPATKAAKPAKPAQDKSAANRAAKKAAAPAPGTPRNAPKTGSPYDIVFHPMVTEKTMFNMDKNNALEFIVAPRASKPEIKAAIEQLFTVKVEKVTTRITREGKRAVVRFAEGYSAEDIGTRIGVF